MTYAEESDQSQQHVTIDEWLVSEKLAVPRPAMAEESFNLSQLLAFEQKAISDVQPSVNSYAWHATTVNSQGILTISATAETPEVVYLATFLTIDRFGKLNFSFDTPHLARVYINGEKVTEKLESNKDKPGNVKFDKALSTGSYLIMIKLLKDPENEMPLQISGTITSSPAIQIHLSTAPQRILDTHIILDRTRITGVSISGDGSLAAISYAKNNPQTAKSEHWIELFDTKSGKTVQTYRGGTAISGIRWAPRQLKFAYTDTKDGKSTVWIVDISNGTTTAVLKDVENFGSFQWSPTETFIIYTVTDKAKDDDSGLKRLQSPRDRWPGFRNKSFLYRVNLNDGTNQRLTAGHLSTNLADIHPSGKKLLFTTTVDDYQHRPYTRTTAMELDLGDLSVDTLFSEGWFGGLRYAPDGKQLLVTGSARIFNNAGVNLPKGMIPNEYDTQAYLYSMKDGHVTAITKFFNPSVESAEWSRDGKYLYVTATDSEYVRLFRYDIAKRKFEQLESGFEVINDIDMANTAPLAVAFGSSAQMPHRVHLLDLHRLRWQVLSDPAASEFKHVRFGEMKKFTFTNNQGTLIDGRIYYPPDYDSNKRYPAIVYYYGGTSVTDRSFGGRYPKNLYAAQGYVVYVVQPSGATGYGQAFSALHVNAWGKQTSDDIIMGVQKFLEANPSVDPERVGCIGASYGGFMTMYLLTKTDIFAAGVAHAGISSISSYWGEGYWGYLYSAAATAESFPWNRKDIYVDQSPLFRADKMNTPLLLLHGDSDTNVPPGESDQFYIALKLLQKPVEYVKVAGQDHHILDYKKRLKWQDTIFAWFDKQLKGQPDWWNELYPETK
jgi:dipeptidyl aminopeptidase/acylaminoacyl peptidase